MAKGCIGVGEELSITSRLSTFVSYKNQCHFIPLEVLPLPILVSVFLEKCSFTGMENPLDWDLGTNFLIGLLQIS